MKIYLIILLKFSIAIFPLVSVSQVYAELPETTLYEELLPDPNRWYEYYLNPNWRKTFPKGETSGDFTISNTNYNDVAFHFTHNLESKDKAWKVEKVYDTSKKTWYFSNSKKDTKELSQFLDYRVNDVLSVVKKNFKETAHAIGTKLELNPPEIVNNKSIASGLIVQEIAKVDRWKQSLKNRIFRPNSINKSTNTTTHYTKTQCQKTKDKNTDSCTINYEYYSPTKVGEFKKGSVDFKLAKDKQGTYLIGKSDVKGNRSQDTTDSPRTSKINEIAALISKDTKIALPTDPNANIFKPTLNRLVTSIVKDKITKSSEYICQWDSQLQYSRNHAKQRHLYKDRVLETKPISLVSESCKPKPNGKNKKLCFGKAKCFFKHVAEVTTSVYVPCTTDIDKSCNDVNILNCIETHLGVENLAQLDTQEISHNLNLLNVKSFTRKGGSK